jgi:hypothetical protein
MLHRRQVLKSLLAGLPVAAAAVSAHSVRAAQAVKEATKPSWDELKQRVDALEQSDAKTRKLVRTALALAALSMGFDVSTIL